MVALAASYSQPILSATDKLPIVIVGDSVVNGANAGSLAATFRSVMAREFSPDRYIINYGVGGDAPGPTADRIIPQLPDFPNYPVIVLLGRPDYAQPATDYTAAAQRIWDARQNDYMAFAVPMPGANANEMTQNSVEMQICAAARQELMETFPNNYIDVMWDAYWSQITGADTSDDQLAVPNFVPGTTPPRSQIVMGTADPNDGRGYTPPKFLDDPIHPDEIGHPRIGVTLPPWVNLAQWP